MHRNKSTIPAPHRPTPLQSLLNEGLSHHRANRLAEASQAYSAILRQDPEHADALNLSGVLARQRGDLSISERFISKAIRRNPSVSTYHHHLARTRSQQGNIPAAVESYQKALALNPTDVDSLEHLAALVSPPEAIELYQRLLKLRPDTPAVYFNLAALLNIVGQPQASLDLYRQAATRFPTDPDAHYNLGKALRDASLRAEAIAAFRAVISLKPDDAESHNILGTLLHESGQPFQAKQSYLQALHLQPDHPLALCNLGALLMDFGEWQASEIMLRKAVQLEPALLAAHCNLGSLFAKQGHALAAIESLRHVLQIDPTHVDALCTLGNTLDNLGDEAGALTCFQLALQLHPTHPLARFNLSVHQLLAGNLAEGWAGYDLRWQVRESIRNARTFSQPRWQGEQLAARSVFLHAEQGFGDTIQFARYALLLAGQGAQVILEVQPHLQRLLQNLHTNIQTVTRDVNAPNPETDFHCPLLSLPLLFQTTLETIPSQVPYIPVSPDKIWAERIAPSNLRVGAVWSGNPDHMRDRLRSIPFDQFSHLFQAEGVTFYSLQKGPATASLTVAPAVVDLAPYLHDFTDTAAALAHLDLVITVDTAVAHLAGALGIPVWILLHHAPDWRWLKDRSDSPWYPTARLFRQTTPGNWPQVLSSVAAHLQQHPRTRLDLPATHQEESVSAS